jgi:4-carboxymuconolactone decarboxylase
MPRALARYTLLHLFGDVWQGDDLAIEERSLVTCAVLVALGRESEQRAHFRGARNLGIPREKLEAMITHVAHYAGWPVAVSASSVLDEVWQDMDAAGVSAS